MKPTTGATRWWRHAQSMSTVAGARINYDVYLSERSRARRPSAIRALQPLLAEPGMISLGGGMPNKATFPFKSLTCGTDGGTFELVGADLEEVLQYSGTRGLSSLLAHLQDIQQAEHGVATPDPYEICVSTGSQDALSKAFDLFTAGGPQDAPILVEEPTYSGSLAYLQPTGTQLVGVPCDSGGLNPVALAEILRGWNSSGPPRPRVLYTIPVGSNPTGASLTLERKKEIYSIARKFELLILEDDPYYWMQFSSQRTPSFLSMDVDGRVLRFDSFSKLLSSGLRVGFVSGPPALIERIELHQQASVLHSSGVSQALVAGLFDQWAAANGGSIHAGFSLHCEGIVDYYRERRDFFLASADKHLLGLCDWSVPSAGMFVWMKLPVEDADAFIKSKARKAKVLLVPGQSFDPHDRPSPYARAAFSTATLVEIDEALRRLAELLAEETKC